MAVCGCKYYFKITLNLLFKKISCMFDNLRINYFKTELNLQATFKMTLKVLDKIVTPLWREIKDYKYCFDSLAIRLRSKDLKTPYPKNQTTRIKGLA